MPNPAWFDEKHFAAQKAEQMNAIGWRDAAGHVKTDWKAEDWPGALARFNSEHNTNYSAYDNFMACNGSGYESGIVISAVNVSPNPLFDIPIYLSNLAAHYTQIGFRAPGYTAWQWTPARALQHLFENEHISAWDHFKTYGLQNQINPSNEFDVGAYLRARAEAMGQGHNVQDAISELLQEKINPIEDYYAWGQTHGIKPQAVSKPVQPGIDLAHVWGGPINLPDDKPVDDDPDDPTSPGGGGGSNGGDSNVGDSDIPGGSNGGGSNNGGGSSQPGGDKPVQPEQPDAPVQPEQPDAPGQPDNPDDPVQPDNPDDPVQPEQPGKPTQPGDYPDEPQDPVIREDAYDKDVKEEAIGSSEPATSPAGQNTLFTGSYDGESGTGLTPDSVINAGADARNSIVMDLSASWPGFKGVEQNGQTEPSVTNVGRVVLNVEGAAADKAITFDAQNISTDLEQVDINNSGGNTIALEQLPDSVKAVNIKDVKAGGSNEAPATSIAFATPPQTLRIGVENVCADAGGAAAINTTGVKELTIASYGTANSINLRETQGIEKLVIAEGAALNIADSNGAGINEYDASAATRSVNIGVSGFKDGAVVKGGSGKADALTFMDNVQVDQANWSGIEELVFKEGGDVNAAKATDISKIVQDGNAQDITVTNLTADTLQVVATENAEKGMARTCAIMRAQGKIGDVSWSTHGTTEFGSELTADFVCDATGDAYITMRGKDRLGVSSVFEFSQMTGTLTIDDPNPTDPGAYIDSSIQGVKLTAPNATGLNIIHTGSMKICGNLQKVENVDVKMTDYKDAGVNGLFKLPVMHSANNVDISADRMDIYISGLGSQNASKGMDLAIHNAADVHIDHIRGAAGAAPINAVIDSYGNVEIGEIDSGGDVNLTVSGVNIVATPNDYGVNDGFKGASLNLDFSQVHGDVGSSAMYIDLEALGGSLNYKGARGSDNLLVGALSGGTISSLNTGSGDDEVVVQTLKSIGRGQTATVDVDLGAGVNILRVFSMNQEGNLIVNASSSGGMIHTIAYECPPGMAISSVAAANAALSQIDAGFQLDADAFVHDGVFEYGGNAYWIGNRVADGASNVTLVVAENTGAGVFVPDDPTGV